MFEGVVFKLVSIMLLFLVLLEVMRIVNLVYC